MIQIFTVTFSNMEPTIPAYLRQLRKCLQEGHLMKKKRRILTIVQHIMVLERSKKAPNKRIKQIKCGMIQKMKMISSSDHHKPRRNMVALNQKMSKRITFIDHLYPKRNSTVLDEKRVR